MYDNLVDFATS